MALSRASLPAPSIQILLASYLVLITFMLGLGWPWPQDPDIWWHLKTGEWMAQHGQIMRTDPFGFLTHGLPVTLPSWSVEIIFYEINHVAPHLGLRLLQGLVVAATVTVLLFHAWLASRSFRLALLLAALFLVPLFPWVARPQIFSFMFVAVTMLVLWWGQNRNVRALWILPPLMLLWANVHAYFIVGLGFSFLVLGLPWLHWAFHRSAAQPKPQLLTLWVLGLVAMAPLVNPYGFGLYREILFMAAHASKSWAAEWIIELQSPDFQAWPMKVFFGWVALTIMAFLFSSKRASGLTIFIFLGLLYQALQHRRDVPYFLIIMLPVVAEHIAHIPGTFLQRMLKVEAPGQALRPCSRVHASLHWLLLATALAGFVFAPFRLAPVLPTPESVPDFHNASRYLSEKRLPGPIYNSLGKGGYLIYTLWPNYRTLIDGRTGLYSEKDWEDHNDIRQGRPDWYAKLSASGVCTVIWEQKAALASLLQLKSEWTQVYQDDHAVIFVRKQCRLSHETVAAGD